MTPEERAANIMGSYMTTPFDTRFKIEAAIAAAIRAAETEALEWAASNHSHDCSICWNGGRCPERASIDAEIERRKKE